MTSNLQTFYYHFIWKNETGRFSDLWWSDNSDSMFPGYWGA